MAGGAAGLAVGEVGLKLLSPVQTPLNWTVLIFLMAVSLITGVACGAAPVIQTLRSDTNTIIKTGSATGGGASGIRSALVVAEFALAMLLVTGAGILIKSFVRLSHVDPGFSSRGLLTMRVAIPNSRKPDVLFRRIQDQVRQIPGVDSFASTSALPLTPNHGNAGRFNVPGSPLINPDSLPAGQLRWSARLFHGHAHRFVPAGFNERSNHPSCGSMRPWPAASAGKNRRAVHHRTLGAESYLVYNHRSCRRCEAIRFGLGTESRPVLSGARSIIDCGAHGGESEIADRSCSGRNSSG